MADDGTVWSWGHNFYGELGNGTREHSDFPKQVELFPINGVRKTLKEIVQIASVGYHTLALNTNGEVFSWGSNNFGELGLGNSDERIEIYAKKVDLPRIVQVATGWHHSVALDVDGNIWYWGKDQAKKYAGKEDQIINKPTLFENLPKMVKIACGSWHSLSLDENGSVWGWGRNRYGLLATGDTVSRSFPIKMAGFEDVVDIGGGCFQTLAVDKDGNILTCGDNPSGQQGINSTQNLFKATSMMLNIFGNMDFENYPKVLSKSEIELEKEQVKQLQKESKARQYLYIVYIFLGISVFLNLVGLTIFLRKGSAGFGHPG